MPAELLSRALLRPAHRVRSNLERARAAGVSRGLGQDRRRNPRLGLTSERAAGPRLSARALGVALTRTLTAETMIRPT